MRQLHHARYEGPLTVEWEDPNMDREAGAAEACAFVRRVDFPPSGRAFDASFVE
jgi:sugar phosphate isomerase/epimerase